LPSNLFPVGQGPIKPLVFLVSTKRTFYLTGVPVGSGVGCEEGTADGAAEGGGEGSSEGGKVGNGKGTGVALVACAGRLM
jgi:hypothetical protein